MKKANHNDTVDIEIYDEYRSINHKFTFHNFWSPPFRVLRRNLLLHPILNDENNSDEEKVKKMEEIVSTMKSQDEVKKLLSDKDKDGCTPLHVAAYHDSEKCCEFLIRWGAKIDEGNSLSYSPLFYATVGDGLSSARVLLKHGANPKARAYMDQHQTRSWVCFHYAQFMKRVDMMMLIFNFHTDIIACTLNVGEEKYNPMLFCFDPIVMKRCLLMYRKYCYDFEMEKTECATCKLAIGGRVHCANCFSVSYCNRSCQAKHTSHLQKCTEEGHNVRNDNCIPHGRYMARVRHLVLDFYGSTVFPAVVVMTKPYNTLFFIGFGTVMLAETPTVLEKHIKDVLEQQKDKPEKKSVKSIIPVWVCMYSTSRKPMKMFLRKSLPEGDNKSMDKSLFVYTLQSAM